VEEAAAAASSLEDQAGKLRSAVAVFQLDDGGYKAPERAAPRRVASAARPMPARRAAPAAAVTRTPASASTANAAPVAAAPASAPARAPARTVAAAPSAGGDQDWETF
jgi:methyl-accepting chemotaxis protein-1 (serine sensor receptor)